MSRVQFNRLTRLSEIIYPRNFPPDARTNVPRPSQFGIAHFEELFIPTPDGESLSAFFIRANKQHARNVTVLMFHGNAGNIGYRLPIAKILENELRCNVLMLQYRGYGLSSGNPNEKGLMIDAQTGLDYIRQRQELRNTKIVVYGQSIGGAVSIGLVARNQKHGDIAGIVLENTFTSLKKLIPRSAQACRISSNAIVDQALVPSLQQNTSLLFVTRSGPAKQHYHRSRTSQFCSSVV
jgi:fermentation-respiration switch protein FrsA (DUF1100 family)